jgi:hypothetical protein
MFFFFRSSAKRSAVTVKALTCGLGMFAIAVALAGASGCGDENEKNANAAGGTTKDLPSYTKTDVPPPPKSMDDYKAQGIKGAGQGTGAAYPGAPKPKAQ